MKTTNATAASEFRAGMTDAQNISFESAAAHFKAATNADPNFGLARVLYASTYGLSPDAQKQIALNLNFDMVASPNFESMYGAPSPVSGTRPAIEPVLTM